MSPLHLLIANEKNLKFHTLMKPLTVAFCIPCEYFRIQKLRKLSKVYKMNVYLYLQNCINFFNIITDRLCKYRVSYPGSYLKTIQVREFCSPTIFLDQFYDAEDYLEAL